jgi:hypothetical protein
MVQSQEKHDRKQASPAFLSIQFVWEAIRDLKTSLVLGDHRGTPDSYRLYPVTAS